MLAGHVARTEPWSVLTADDIWIEGPRPVASFVDGEIAMAVVATGTTAATIIDTVRKFQSKGRQRNANG